MKLKLLPLIFLGIYFANSSQFYSKLPQSACEIVSEVHKKESWMKTIAIVKFEKNFDEKLIDELAKCLPQEITLVLMDGMTYNLKLLTIHNVDIVVLLIDAFNRQTMDAFTLLVYDMYVKPIIDHTSKFLVLTSKTDGIYLKALKANLDGLSILNFTIIFEASGEVFVDFYNNRDKPLPLNTKDIEKIYPNHLKDLKKHRHYVLVNDYEPGIKLINGALRGKPFYYFDIVKRMENSEISYILMRGTENERKKAFEKYFYTREAQMSISKAYKTFHYTPKLMTYEVTGICPLVPKPEGPARIFSFHKPFDWQIWSAILISIICCMALWKFSGSSTSIWYIPFFFWAFFQGQGINFATNKKVLVIVLQILVFMLFILGNAYQGVITSFMIEPEQTGLFKSFDELLKSEHIIFVNVYRDLILRENPNYQQAMARGKIYVPNNTVESVNLTNTPNTAFLITCELANALVSSGDASEFYVINENMFSEFIQLPAISLNKYLKRWQLIMDWCFEAGLPQAWERFVSEEKIFKKVEEELSDILKFGDIAKVFYVLVSGLILGVIILICEIVWHKFGEDILARRNSLRNLTVIKRLRKVQIDPATLEE